MKMLLLLCTVISSIPLKIMFDTENFVYISVLDCKLNFESLLQYILYLNIGLK